MRPIELRNKGYQALISKLGLIDAIRFLEIARWGSGNYPKEHNFFLGNTTRFDFGQDLRGKSSRKSKYLSP
jgi:hypothetical protein